MSMPSDQEARIEALRRRAEALIAGHVSEHDTPTPDEVRRLVYELEVHRAELEMQNQELVEASTQLEASRDRYADLYDFAPLGYATLDAACVIRDLNLTAARWLGKERRRLLGRSLTGFLQVEDRALLRTHLRACIREQQDLTCEVRLEAGDGPPRPVQMRSIPDHTAPPDEPRCRTAITDLTDHHRMEQERARLLRRVGQAEKLRSLSVLTGGIAHKFNNLMLVILGRVSLAALAAPPSSKLAGELEEIRRSAEQAAELTREILAFAGQGRFTMERLDLNEVVRGAEALLRTGIAPPVSLHIDVSGEPVPVNGDRTAIEQALAVLTTNAAEATGTTGGEISIRTGVVTARAGDLADSHLGEDLLPGEYGFAEVADQGCGMDEETQFRIYDPFFSTKLIGRGLGLASALGLSRSHGGTLRMESETGKGTTFRLLLPLDTERPRSA